MAVISGPPGCSMVIEMAEFLIETLVERLKAAELSVPWVQGLAVLGKKFGSAQNGETEGRILAVTRGNHWV